MDPQSPYAVLSLIAAPAVLTNAASILIMSTISRMLRTRDAMSELLAESIKPNLAAGARNRLIEQVNRVERQGAVLLLSLRSLYISLAAFASATLVTLLGAALSSFMSIGLLSMAFAILGILLGLIGVGGLVDGCVNLFRATQISLVNIRCEAAVARENLAPPQSPAPLQSP